MNEPTPARRAARGVAFLFLLAGVALGATVVSETYGEIKGSGAAGEPIFVARFMGLTGADSHTVSATAALANRTFLTRGEPFVELVPRFSARNATAEVCVNRRAANGRIGGVADIQTATALDGNLMVYDGTGYYGYPLRVPTTGWSAVEVLVFNVSSGTVDLLPVRCGVNGMAAAQSETQ